MTVVIVEYGGFICFVSLQDCKVDQAKWGLKITIH